MTARPLGKVDRRYAPDPATLSHTRPRSTITFSGLPREAAARNSIVSANAVSGDSWPSPDDRIAPFEMMDDSASRKRGRIHVLCFSGTQVLLPSAMLSIESLDRSHSATPTAGRPDLARDIGQRVPGQKSQATSFLDVLDQECSAGSQQFTTPIQGLDQRHMVKCREAHDCIETRLAKVGCQKVADDEFDIPKLARRRPRQANHFRR